MNLQLGHFHHHFPHGHLQSAQRGQARTGGGDWNSRNNADNNNEHGRRYVGEEGAGGDAR